MPSADAPPPPLGTPLTGIEQATPEWLTGVLRARGALARGRVTGVRSTPRSTLVSATAQLEVDYSAGAPRTAPERLFLKLGGANGSGGPSAAGREAEFYLTVAAGADDLPLAPCFDAVFDPDSGRSHLLLADLSATHSQTPWPLPPTQERCEQAVESLARVHARWWQDPRLGRGLGELPGGERIRRSADETASWFQDFADYLGDRLSQLRRALFERVVAALPALWERRRRELYEARQRLTLLHGDAHFWSFLYPADRRRDRVCIIDWEVWRPGRGSDDLAYMIALHWYPERRRAHERDLVRRYHRTLDRHGVAGYRWDDCWNDYRHSAIGNLLVPVWQWSAGLPPDVWWPHLERAVLAFQDLGCAELLE